MFQVGVEALLTFAKGLVGETLNTLHDERPFTIAKVDVEGRVVQFVTSQDNPQRASGRWLQETCETFSRTNSYRPKDYTDTHGVSYTLALIKRFQESHAANASGGGLQAAINGRLPEEVAETPALSEGAVSRVTVNAYERNPEARRRCIETHGTNCFICGFNFGAVYGEVAEGYIHVHHLRPLSEMGGEYVVDPVENLRPVCPNCHGVLHLGGMCRSIEEVRQLVERNRAEPGAAADRPRE
jgi:hypothetical protein